MWKPLAAGLGIAAGTLAGLWVLRRRGAEAAAFMDAAAPAILVAQAIGRVGNYFNQELFGGPTTLPWALEIDPAHRPRGYERYATFHPTFLYELIYDVAMAGVLILVGRRFRIRPPGLFALYVAIYCFGRFFEELLRVDPAHHFAGLRLNAWVSIVVFTLATAFFVWWQFVRRGPTERRAVGRPVVPEGPKMAIPRGRVRPTR